MPPFRFKAAPVRTGNEGQFFPFPVPRKTTEATGTGTLRPFSMTLPQAVELWWRVKAFSATFSLDYKTYFQPPSEFCSSGEFNTGTFPSQTLDLTLQLPTSERDLVLQNEWETSARSFFTDSTTGTAFGTNCDGSTSEEYEVSTAAVIYFGGDLESGYVFAPPFIIDDDDLLWPYLEFNIGGFESFVDVGSGLYTFVTKSLILNSGSFSVDLYYATPVAPNLFTPTLSDITANSFHPYDPGDGDGPIWNATTGAQLRDPFSIQ